MAVRSVWVVFEAGLPFVRPGPKSPPGMGGEEWADSTPHAPAEERLAVGDGEVLCRGRRAHQCDIGVNRLVRTAHPTSALRYALGSNRQVRLLM